MPPRRPAFRPVERLELAEWLHMECLVAIMRVRRWSVGELAFQGGTALHLCYGSPRYSEDLDFLLRSGVPISELQASLESHLRQAVQVYYPDGKITLKGSGESQRNPANIEARFEHPDVLTKLVVKMEFFRTSNELLTKYQTHPRQPLATNAIYRVHVPGFVPTADLEEIYLDKMHAFATRPYIKYRDVFDLWWLTTQKFAELDYPSLAGRFLYHHAMYRMIRDEQFAPRFRERASALSVHDLKAELESHLPQEAQALFDRKACEQMIGRAREELNRFADAYQAILASKAFDPDERGPSP